MQDPWEDVKANLGMLVNVVEAVEAAQGANSGVGGTAGDDTNGGGAAGLLRSADGRLQHVYVQSGSKWYGQHLGKYKTPAKETDSRCVQQ